MSEETQQVCPSCGNGNPVGAQFCRECGAILVQSRGKTTPPVSIPPQQTPGTPRPTGSGAPQRSRAGLVWAAVVAVILLAAFLADRYVHPISALIPVPGEPEVTPTSAEGGLAAPTTVPTKIPTVAPTMRPTDPPVVEPTTPPSSPFPTERAAVEVSPPPQAPTPRYEPDGEPTKRPTPSIRPSARTHPATGSTGRFATGWYRMRYRAPLLESPSETAPVVTYLKSGTRIRVTGSVGGFLRVESSTGRQPGYVSTDDAVLDSNR